MHSRRLNLRIKKWIHLSLLTLVFVASQHGISLADSVNRGLKGTPAGYLFLHMTSDDYGRLYYSASEDGLHWRLLNGGKRIFEDYRGHPDIMQGHDGRYYLLGNPLKKPQNIIRIWATADFIHWEKVAEHQADMSDLPQYNPLTGWHGAAKMFYDDATGRYIITWHSTTVKERSDEYWNGMRTLYILTKDFKTFTKPKRLLPYDMASIDVIIRKEKDTYYAIIKDEKYPDFDWPTGKSIRICSADKVTGPYSKPSVPVSPNFHEAPTLIPRKDGQGWYLWYERYPGKGYSASTAATLVGPWYMEYCMKYAIPEQARHGCMIALNQAQYDAVMKQYDIFVEAETPPAKATQ